MMIITARIHAGHGITYAVCPQCGSRGWRHRDGEFKCGCLPDPLDDPIGEEYERLKAEARRLHRAGLLNRDEKFKGNPHGIPVAEHELGTLHPERSDYD